VAPDRPKNPAEVFLIRLDREGSLVWTSEVVHADGASLYATWVIPIADHRYSVSGFQLEGERFSGFWLTAEEHPEGQYANPDALEIADFEGTISPVYLSAIAPSFGSMSRIHDSVDAEVSVETLPIGK
jgi:hypothetical protein